MRDRSGRSLCCFTCAGPYLIEFLFLVGHPISYTRGIKMIHTGSIARSPLQPSWVVSTRVRARARFLCTAFRIFPLTVALCVCEGESVRVTLAHTRAGRAGRAMACTTFCVCGEGSCPRSTAACYGYGAHALALSVAARRLNRAVLRSCSTDDGV